MVEWEWEWECCGLEWSGGGGVVVKLQCYNGQSHAIRAIGCRQIVPVEFLTVYCNCLPQSAA